MTERSQIITRIKRKADIMHLDAKAKGNPQLAGDASEIIALAEMLERMEEKQ